MVMLCMKNWVRGEKEVVRSRAHDGSHSPSPNVIGRVMHFISVCLGEYMLKYNETLVRRINYVVSLVFYIYNTIVSWWLAVLELIV